MGPGSALSPPDSGPRLYIIWGLGGSFEVGEYRFWGHGLLYPFVDPASKERLLTSETITSEPGTHHSYRSHVPVGDP